MIRELWATNGSVRLEVLEWRPTAGDGMSATPIVGVHGAIGSAQSWRDEGEAASSGRLGGRTRALGAFSRRGMGRSDAPASGYGLREFVGDTTAAVAALGYSRYVLAGHSLGVPIAITYAAGRPPGLVALVLGDYGARFPAFDDTWMDQIEERHRSGGSAAFDLDGVKAMRAESHPKDLSDELGSITCPVLVVTGDRDVSLTSDDRERYERSLADVRVVTLTGAGHMLSVDGRADSFHAELGRFAAQFDLPAVR